MKHKRLPLFEDFALDIDDPKFKVKDVILALKNEGYGNDKIIKVKNFLDIINGYVSLENVVDAMSTLGVDPNTISNITSMFTGTEEENTVYVSYDNNFYKFSFEEWKDFVDQVVSEQMIEIPENSSERPKHIYKSSDGKYYSSIDHVIVFVLDHWEIEDYESLKDKGYK